MNIWKMTGVIVLFLLIILSRNSLSKPPQDKGIRRKAVDEWKQQLNSSSFAGKVISIEKSDNNSKYYAAIIIRILDSGNLNLPDGCRYLKFKNGMLVLDVHYQNIHSSSVNEIFPGNTIKKYCNNDTLYIYENNRLKYYFEIFDGIKKPLNE